MNRRNFLLTTSVLAVSTVFGGLYWGRRWKYIVVHHSAGRYGTIEFLQQVHRERQARDPIKAIPYHYVIGNGNGLAMGEVASDWRQEYDIWGSHLSARNSGRNFLGIGICLIGNFDEHELPEQQFKALVRLTKNLMTEHNIDPRNITGHGYVDGELTRCPGKYFPMDAFTQALV